MRTCKLFIRNLDMPNQFYEAQVSEVSLRNGRSVSKVVSTSAGSPDDVCTFMIRNGISVDDIKAADATMLMNDHDCAHFGINGGFLYTEFSGYLQ